MGIIASIPEEQIRHDTYCHKELVIISERTSNAASIPLPRSANKLAFILGAGASRGVRPIAVTAYLLWCFQYRG
jgi:hypothetical protein